jgi:DNA-binding NarL/FixJ family response regulator
MPAHLHTSPSNPKPIRVLLVDDMTQVRQELRFLLELDGKVIVVGEAVDGLDAIRQAEKLRPDVVVIDLEMPGLDGYQATREIREHNLARRVVVLSVHDDAIAIERARIAGAVAFIQKGADYKDLLRAIQLP